MLGCLAQSLTRGGSSSVRFTVTGRHRLSAPTLRVPIRAYRVTATAQSAVSTSPPTSTSSCSTLAGALSEMSFATYEQAPPAASSRPGSRAS